MSFQLWAALEHQFSHGKQKAGARQKGGGASKRAASGGPTASDCAAPAAVAGVAAAVGAVAPALGRPGAADHNLPPLSYDVGGKNAVGASPGMPCMNGLVYTGPAAAKEDAAATGGAAADAAVPQTVERVPSLGEIASESTLQQTSTSGRAGISPPNNPLTPAASGSHRGSSQTNWQGEGQGKYYGCC